MNSQTICQ